jgi:2-dehydro-3-deoxy-D-gluconate 5-dehydrogenase
MGKRFDGKVVMVTGASRGIGQASAVAFAQNGAKVIGVARSSQAETAALAKKDGGGAFDAVEFDFGDAAAGPINDLVKQVVARHGRLDVLVNNAGTIRRGAAIDFAAKDWDDVIRINLSSPFFLTQAVGRWWINEGRAKAAPNDRLRIVSIASMLSFQGGIRIISYTAAKHGIAGITRALANEWAGERINVNAIAPGYITTENTRALREDPVRNKSILERIPQGGWGAPADIAGGVMWLASSDADYVNGSVINIDGGWLAR